MAKTILDFEASGNPKNEDLLVYDAYQKRFIQRTKSSFLKVVFEEIDSLKKQNEALKNELNLARADILKLAKILRGEIQ